MHHVLQAWELPLPEDFSESGLIRARLERLPRRASQKLDEFASRLLARRVAGVGAGQTLRGPVMTLQLARADAQALRLAIHEAGECGLALHDEDSGCTWMPGGWALTPRGRRRGMDVLSPDAEMSTVSMDLDDGAPLPDAATARGLLVDRMAALLAGAGFSALPSRRGPAVFERVDPEVVQSLSVDVQAPGAGLSASVRLSFEARAGASAALRARWPRDANGAPVRLSFDLPLTAFASGSSPRTERREEFALHGAVDVELLADWLHGLCARRLLPMAESARGLAGLAALMQDGTVRAALSLPRLLRLDAALSWLAGRPDWSERRAALEQAIAAWARDPAAPGVPPASQIEGLRRLLDGLGSAA